MRASRCCKATARMPALARTAPNAAVKFDPRSRIMNLTRSGLFAEIHEQVAGLLGGPTARWDAGCDPEDADAPGPVLDHGQDIGLGAVEQGRP